MLKSGIYDFVKCRGGTDMCFVLGFGRKRPDLKQYRISGLTTGVRGLPNTVILHSVAWTSWRCTEDKMGTKKRTQQSRAQYTHCPAHAKCLVTKAPTCPRRANDQGPCPLCYVT